MALWDTFRRTPLGAIAGLCALAGIVAAPNPAEAQPRSVADIANYTGADRQKVLEEGARKEGTLLVYVTGTQIAPLIDRFREKYPFLKVELWRATAEDVSRKVFEEYNSGLFQVDAFELSAHGLVSPRDVGILQPFTSPEFANYPSTAVEPGRHWVSVRESYTGIGYNSKIIPSEQAPKTYMDLLDPKWKGRMAISGSPSTAANWVGAMVLTHGEDFVRKLGQQDVRVFQMTSRAVANLTLSGEAPLSPTTYDSHVAASGPPLAFNVPGPVPVTDTSAAIASKAPHPHAAMLFIDFLLTKEAQQMYQEIGYESPRNGMGSDKFPNLQKLYLANRPNFVDEYESWSRLLKEVFLRGK